MRSLLAATVVLAVILMAYLATVQEPSPESLEPAAAVEAKGPESAPTDALAQGAQVSSERGLVETSPGPPAEPEAAEDDASQTTAVTGVVLDNDGRPIADADVSLAAYETWAPGVEAPGLGPRTPSQWAGYVGYETRTAKDGSFTIQAPAPPANMAMLTIDAGPNHEFWWGRFGGERRNTGPPLEPGTRDIGKVQLAPTGMVIGSVRAEGGGPLEGAMVSVGPSANSSFGQFDNTKTGPDGSFRLGHAPAGTYGIGARLEGYLSVFQEPITVELEATTGPIDLVLAPAPTVEGTVTDASGQPVAEVRVSGWPASSGRGARATTDERGRFTMYLPQDEPYTLEATHADYSTWGDKNDKETLFEPMTRDLTIQLEVASKSRIEVVDRDTGSPIERFGFRILEDNGSEAKRRVYTERRRPPLADHPGGFVETSGRLREDLYLVYAPGYRMASGDMKHDEGRDRTHVVRLDRGASARGRVIDEGVAVPDAAIEIVAIRPSFPDAPVRLESNSMLRTKTDAEGRFACSGLEAQRHRLTVRPPGGSPVSVDSEALALDETYDFGDVELLDPGAIEGRVLLPPGVDPSALRIFLGDWREQNEQVTDSQGGFRFEGLAPGTYTVGHHPRPEEIGAGAVTQVEVPSGGLAQAELDLRPVVLVDVDLTLDLGGIPAEGVRVTLIDEDAPEFQPRGSGPAARAKLGDADSSGRITGRARAMGRAQVEVRLPSVGRFVHPSARLDLNYPGPVRETVRFELATLELELPPAWTLPQEGQLHVEFTDPAADGFPVTARISITAGAPDLTDELLWSQEGERFVIQGLLPGPRNVRVYASEKGAPTVRTQLGPNRWRDGPERLFEQTGEVTLVAGERAVLRLP